MKGHLLAKKSPSRKRFLGTEATVVRSDLNNVRDCLPYAGVA
jgi:ribosomal protein L35